jgi:hypothetical protein
MPDGMNLGDTMSLRKKSDLQIADIRALSSAKRLRMKIATS